MTIQDDQTPATPSALMHQTVDHLSTIVSIAQFSLINEEMSPKLQDDLKRVIQNAHEASNSLKQLADILHEEG